MSLTVKFALFTSLLCLLIIAGTSYLSYLLARDELAESVGRRLEAIATTGAIGIDGTLHDQVKGREDVDGPAFQTIREHLLQVKQANHLKQEVYTFRRVDEKLAFVVMTNEKHFVGDTYSIKRAMLPTLNQGKTAHTGIYEDVNGAWISGYAPIYDQNHQISGMLEVDIEVSEFMALLRHKYMPLVYKSVAFAILAVIFSFLLARSVTRKLNYLTDITQKISLGKMDTPINVDGSDEVAKLGASLERMRESLKIAAELIE